MVAISDAAREFDREYHYIVPHSMIGRLKAGMRVIVPFGKTDRPREAYVLKLVDETPIKELKEIKKVMDESPVLNERMLKLAAWMRTNYMCTYSDAIRCMIPPGAGIRAARIVRLVKNSGAAKPEEEKIVNILEENNNECEYEELKHLSGVKHFARCIKALQNAGIVCINEEYTARVNAKKVRMAYLSLPYDEVLEDIENNRINKIQHIRILEMLIEHGQLPAADIARFARVSPSVLDTLKKYGYIDFKEVEVKRDPVKHMAIQKTMPLNLTAGQKAAFANVRGQLEKGEFGEILIHGVTGSGKTEIYMQLIDYATGMGKRAIVLVPEISLTPQMVERFKGRFGEDVAVLHSRLSLGERYDQWRLIKDGDIKIVVGARSAVFAPVENLGIIIIDEEHENSYKSEIKPKYHAAEIARKRCEEENAVLVYGSATPSVETYFRARCKHIGFARLATRVNSAVLPRISIVDMRKELEEGNRSIFSRLLLHEIQTNILNGQQTMLFLNRRGHSSFVLCRNCGHVVRCVNCNVSMTYHSRDSRLICHYCGYTSPPPRLCPACKSTYIRHFGTGTQKAEEEIKKIFPDCSVIRMDLDTTGFKNSHEEILHAFRDNNINIMIGTQMIAKGHDFPNVTLVGILAADSLLNTGDYRAGERTFQLVTQVAGRAGRGELPGRAVIQSYNTEDFSILAACNHDYESFYEQEIKIREKLGYPPFTNIAALILSGIDDRQTFKKSEMMRDFLKEYVLQNGVEAQIIGLARAPISKIKNKYRWRIIIKCKDKDRLVEMLTQASDEFRSNKGKNDVELSVDINPFNML